MTYLENVDINKINLQDEDRFVGFCASEEKMLIKAIQDKDVRLIIYAALEYSRIIQMYLRARGSLANGVEICNKLMAFSNILKAAANNKTEFPEIEFRLFSEGLQEASARLMHTALMVKDRKSTTYGR